MNSETASLLSGVRVHMTASLRILRSFGAVVVHVLRN